MSIWRKCSRCGHVFVALYPLACPQCRCPRSYTWVPQAPAAHGNPLLKAQVPPKWWVDTHLRPRFSVWDGRPLFPGQIDFPKPKKPFGW